MLFYNLTHTGSARYSRSQEFLRRMRGSIWPLLLMASYEPSPRLNRRRWSSLCPHTRQSICPPALFVAPLWMPTHRSGSKSRQWEFTLELDWSGIFGVFSGWYKLTSLMAKTAQATLNKTRNFILIFRIEIAKCDQINYNLYNDIDCGDCRRYLFEKFKFSPLTKTLMEYIAWKKIRNEFAIFCAIQRLCHTTKQRRIGAMVSRVA